MSHGSNLNYPEQVIMEDKKLKIMMNSGRIKIFFYTRKKLVESIRNKGCEVIIGGYEKENEHLCTESGLKFAHIPFSRAGMNPFADIKVINKYRDYIRDEHIDIYHSYTAKPNIYGSIGAKKAGVDRIYPTVNGLGYAFTESGSGSLKFKLIRFITCMLYKKAFKCATKVFFQNPDDMDELVRRKLIPADKCVLIPGSGIDFDMFPYSKASCEPFVFLMATRMLVSKGVREYFEAARIVKKAHPEVIFQIAGALDSNPDGIREEELKSYTDDGTIEYLGFVDMTEALTKCSVFVLPSFYREGVPHAVLEALGTGRAVITCSTPGCKETICDPDSTGKGTNGFLIPPKNSAVLAEKMMWMVEHPDEVIKMGDAGRKYAEDRFDAEKVNKLIMETMGIL